MICSDDLKKLQNEANLEHTPTELTYRYRMAIIGEAVDDDCLLVRDWEDKPHRLVTDLCRHIEELSANNPHKENKELRAILEEAETAHDVIALKRDMDGSGRVKVANAIQRIKRLARILLAANGNVND